MHFPRGVRTAWHTHPAGQNLIVTQGKIYTGTADGIVQIARPGDVVLCPPGVKHWHGAGGLHEDGEYIAVTFEKDGKNVTRLERLSFYIFLLPRQRKISAVCQDLTANSI
ncbi:cupin domain-containing protein [Campylobacter concisus]|uniref:cupin domain-containing protein n=1 Tax=Campylobacter concisus TaxID=199 RepID=UPI002156194A|nr:cupin domain-containing protein [Campylobacter concisus]